MPLQRCLFLASSNAAFAAISTPPGLAAGDHFRIVFTAITHAPATSTDIGTYDASVSARATAGGLNIYNGNPVTWQAIGSTATVSAISRLPISSRAPFSPHGHPDCGKRKRSVGRLFDCADQSR